jgi:porphobilinogen synthase
MPFPFTRLRRLRQSPVLRRMVRETTLQPDDLIEPFFVRPGRRVRRPIASMPGCHQLSVDELVKEARLGRPLGIGAVLLFGIPDRKDSVGSGAYAEDGVVQQAVRALKAADPGIIVMTDLCFCGYTDHGHCGVLKRKGPKDWELDNDATLDLIRKTAVSQARAGADLIAPSGMMDGMVKVIRQALDAAGYQNTGIMAYSAKYASAFYGPFREAAESPPRFGDRASYQMDSANAQEALREVAEDIQEGADIVMVKPALAYLDVVRRVKERFGVPVAAYNVSGEFSMVKAAAAKGWLDEDRTILEMLTSFKRAGADLIITYHARAAARLMATTEAGTGAAGRRGSG